MFAEKTKISTTKNSAFTHLVVLVRIAVLAGIIMRRVIMIITTTTTVVQVSQTVNALVPQVLVIRDVITRKHVQCRRSHRRAVVVQAAVDEHGRGAPGHAVAFALQ